MAGPGGSRSPQCSPICPDIACEDAVRLIIASRIGRVTPCHFGGTRAVRLYELWRGQDDAFEKNAQLSRNAVRCSILGFLQATGRQMPTYLLELARRGNFVREQADLEVEVCKRNCRFVSRGYFRGVDITE